MQGLAAVCFVGILVTIRICWAVYFTQSHKSGKSGQAPGKPEHRPRLVSFLTFKAPDLVAGEHLGCQSYALLACREDDVYMTLPITICLITCEGRKKIRIRVTLITTLLQG